MDPGSQRGSRLLRGDSLNARRSAEGLLAEAEIRLAAIEMALGRSAWAYAVRQSQEAVELSLKALLRHLGMEPPKWHDMASVLEAEKDRLPSGVRAEIEFLSRASRDLNAQRIPSMYGDEEMDLPASALFDEADARGAGEMARTVLGIVRKEILKGA